MYTAKAVMHEIEMTHWILKEIRKACFFVCLYDTGSSSGLSLSPVLM